MCHVVRRAQNYYIGIVVTGYTEVTSPLARALYLINNIILFYFNSCKELSGATIGLRSD